MSVKVSWILGVLLLPAVTASTTSTTRAKQAPALPAARTSPAPAAPVPQPVQPSKPALVQSSKELQSEARALLMQGAASEKPRGRSDAIPALTVLDRNPRSIALIEMAVIVEYGRPQRSRSTL